MHGFVLSLCDGGFEGSGNSVCRGGEVGSIGDEGRLVEVEMVEILVRVGSRKKDACDKKSDSGD